MEVKKLEEKFNLRINIKKSKFMTMNQQFKNCSKVLGVDKVASFKYLGFMISHSKKDMIKHVKT